MIWLTVTVTSCALYRCSALYSALYCNYSSHATDDSESAYVGGDAACP